MKILFAQFSQESNTFSPFPTTLEGSENRPRFFPAADIGKSKQPAIRATMDLQSTLGYSCVPVAAIKFQTGGTFVAAEFDKLLALFTRQLDLALADSGPVDGVFLSLHGAMVAEQYDDVESEVIRQVRERVGNETPLTVSLDPHAHITKRLVQSVNGMVAYKTYPHVDQYETAEAALRMLVDMIQSGRRPFLALEKIPMIVSPGNSASAEGPYQELLKAAREGVESGRVIESSIFPVQPWIDVEDLGTSIVSIGHDAAAAKAEAARLAEMTWAKRHDFDVELLPVAEVVRMAMEREPGRGPVVASYSADSPSAGSCGDGNHVLRELLACGAPEKVTCLHDIVDAPAVEAAMRTGIGNEVETPVGHTLSPQAGKPLVIKGRVTRLGTGEIAHGRFGMPSQMGRCAVIETGKLSLLVHAGRLSCILPSFFRSIGLEPANSDLTIVRSALQFREEYGPIAGATCHLQAPGFSTLDLKSLNFRKIQHPFFPFEDDFDWKNHPSRSTGILPVTKP